MYTISHDAIQKLVPEIGDIKIGDLIGKDGQKHVYQAVFEGQDIVFKILKPNKNTLERVKREILAVRTIAHANNRKFLGCKGLKMIKIKRFVNKCIQTIKNLYKNEEKEKNRLAEIKKEELENMKKEVTSALEKAGYQVMALDELKQSVDFRNKIAYCPYDSKNKKRN